MTSLVEIYCLSYKNAENAKNMTRVFAEQNLDVHFYGGVEYTDPRIRGRSLPPNTQRCWSIMYGHLDMIQLFLQSGNEYGIFCEDDILVRKDFSMHLPNIIRDFADLKLDVLLLSYLCAVDYRHYSNFPEIPISDYSVHPFRYYAYDSKPETCVWGTQMYLLNRQYAQYVVDTYSKDYADKSLCENTPTPFSADWTITKDGNKAMIYPLVSIENCQTSYSDKHQQSCRQKCYDLFYSPDIFG